MRRMNLHVDEVKLQQMERALHDIESRYQLIVENAAEGIWTLDANHRTNYVNPRGAAMLGYTPAEMLGRSPLEFLYPQDRAQATALLYPRTQGIAATVGSLIFGRGHTGSSRRRDASEITHRANPSERNQYEPQSAAGRSDECDLRLQHKNGTPCWAHLTIKPLFDEQAAYQGEIIMYSDITERKRAEDKLAYQASLLANVHDAIIGMDENLNIISWNLGAEKLYGWKESEVLGQKMLRVARTQLSRVGAAEIARALEEAGYFEGELQEFDKHGNPVWVEVSLIAIRDARGDITGHVAVNRNITKRKRAEDALRESETKYRGVVEQSRGLATEIAERKRAEEQIQQKVKDLDVIAQTALALLRMPQDEDVFQYIGEQVRALAGDAIVAVNSYDTYTHETTVRGFLGSPEERDIFVNLLGRDAVGLSFTVTDKYRGKMAGGELERVPGGVHQLSFEQIPLELCGELEQALNIQSVYVTAFMAGENLLGTVAILSHTAEPLSRASVITAFLNQAGVAVQRRRAEEALRLSEERYRRLVELSPLGVTLHRSGKLEYINPAGVRMFGGTDPAQFLGLFLLDFVHPDYRGIVRERVGRMIGNDEVAPLIEEKFLRLDGSAFDVEVAAVMLGARSDHAIQVVFRDITDRKRAAESLGLALEALHQSELRLQMALDSANIGIYEWKPETGELNWDERLRALWGLDPDAPTSYDAFIYGLDPVDRPRVLEALDQVLKANGSRRFDEEYRIVRLNDGVRRWVAATGHLFVEVGKPVRLIGTASDITDYKNAEERIQQLNQQLERRAAELQTANKELESFAYSVSHDLRAPLAAIDGFSRLLLREYENLLPEDGQRFLGLIHENATAMSNLVEDLLTFSRLTRQPLKKQAVNMNEMVRQVLNELGGARMERPVELVVGDLRPALADPILLKQVWVNLISNALKFTRRCEFARIEIGDGVYNGEQAYFVKDNGIGFDMERAAGLFGVFQRLHAPDDYEGTGVGLAIVERIVRRHDGRAWAEAEVGKGATFYFTLGR